jgi:predicted outer membrane protein
MVSSANNPPMQALLTKLGKLEGAAFDRAYVDDQIRDHEKTIALFEREAKTGKEAELKAFAEKTLTDSQGASAIGGCEAADDRTCAPAYVAWSMLEILRRVNGKHEGSYY